MNPIGLASLQECLQILLNGILKTCTLTMSKLLYKNCNKTQRFQQIEYQVHNDLPNGYITLLKLVVYSQLCSWCFYKTRKCIENPISMLLQKQAVQNFLQLKLVVEKSKQKIIGIHFQCFIKIEIISNTKDYSLNMDNKINKNTIFD